MWKGVTDRVVPVDLWYYLIATLGFILVPSVWVAVFPIRQLFAGNENVWVFPLFEALYMTSLIICLRLSFLTATTDPGIIPRGVKSAFKPQVMYRVQYREDPNPSLLSFFDRK